MVANVSFNPVIQTNAAGTFGISSNGYIQGCALDDPAIRNELAGGVLSNSETLPMWGGVGITELIASSAYSNTAAIQQLGNVIRRATALTGSLALTGFSAFDQNHSAINYPQSPVPLVASNMTMNFYRLGCGIRLPVACDPGLVDQYGNVITTQFSWDFVNQQLVEYEPTQTAITITGATWSANVASYTASGAENLVTGDYVTVTGVVSTGAATGFSYNVSGRVTVVDSTHFTLPILGNAGTYSSGGTIAAGGGALNVKVLEIKPDNNMTIQYNATTGFATWNYNGAIAVILV